MENTGIHLPFRVGISPTLGIRGIIATEYIPAGTMIERCPALVYEKDTPVIEKTIFNYYVFDWDDTHESLALGYGSLCNHSYEPNVEVDFDMDAPEILFIAKKDISPGEELLINYNDGSTEPIDPGYLDFDRTQRKT